MTLRFPRLHSLLAGLILLSDAATSRAVIIGEESFNYADGPLAGKISGNF